MPRESTASNEPLAHDLTEVEVRFRTVQSELAVRPIWHGLDRRVVVRTVVSLIAYHETHLIRTRLKTQGLSLHWQSIRGHPAT